MRSAILRCSCAAASRAWRIETGIKSAIESGFLGCSCGFAAFAIEAGIKSAIESGFRGDEAAAARRNSSTCAS